MLHFHILMFCWWYSAPKTIVLTMTIDIGSKGKQLRSVSRKILLTWFFLLSYWFLPIRMGWNWFFVCDRGKFLNLWSAVIGLVFLSHFFTLFRLKVFLFTDFSECLILATECYLRLVCYFWDLQNFLWRVWFWLLIWRF